MADKRANIDLVFRNGLKDYEVLPPPEVWEDIRPVINRKISFLPVVKAAAAVAVIVSIGLLTYRLGMESSVETLPDLVAQNQQTSSAVDYTAPPSISELKHQNVKVVSTNPPEADIEASSVILPESAAKLVSEKVSLFVPKYFMSDFQSTPGLQNPSGGKFAKVSSPDLEAVKYEFITEDVEVPATNRWSVSAMATPTYYSQFSSSGNEISKKLIESDQTQVSYTGGVGLAYKISSRFSIQSGLYYSSLGQEMGGINAYSGFQQYSNSKGGPNFRVLTSNGTVQTNNSDIFLSSYSLPERVITNYTNDVFDPVKASLNYVSNTIYQNMSFLELPVILRYKLIDRKIGINIIGGMSYNLLLNNSVYALVDNGRYPVGTTEGLNTISLSSSLGMGMEYKLSQNLSLNLEPTFRYYLNPFNSANTNGFHPYSVGIFSGIAYKF